MCLKKWSLAWKIRLIQEKNPSVNHRDAQWIPAFAGMTGSVLREWQEPIPRSHAPAWECIPESTLTAPKK